VEAVTLADGRVHRVLKEIVVPPAKRILNVQVTASRINYKPGEQASVRLHVTDSQGKNFVGSTVVSIYDKAVEYIAGGSNVTDIREFFWKWRRHHHPQQDSSLDRPSRNLSLPGKPGMASIGIFGDTVADEIGESNANSVRLWDASGMARSGMAFGFGGGRGGMAKGMMLDQARAPMGAVAEGESLSVAFSPDGAEVAAGGAATQPAAPTVRRDFADTALWVGSLTSDADGMAEVSLKMPENLTTWKVKAWSIGHGTRVGAGETEVVTRKNLLVRLQTPRFLVQKDQAVLSANIHNYLDSDKTVTAVLETEGDQLEPLDPTSMQVIVPAGGERRVDWRVVVRREGMAKVRMLALTDEESDAMESSLPCLVHGLLKTESWAGTVRGDESSARLTIHVPAERRPDQTRLEIRYSPTLAGAMVDALPYLADYPYGCTEQTLNRFLPAAITQKVLLQLNLNLDEIRDKRTNLNAQEVGDDIQRAKQWQRYARNPVFDREQLNRMVKEGVDALTNMQVSDGGWGWFSGWGERSYPHTTAVVVHGLQVAQQNDVAINPGVLERGLDWLRRYQAGEVVKLKNAGRKQDPWKGRADNLDALIYMVLVDAGSDNDEMREFLFRDRVELAVYAKAVFGLALEKMGDREKLSMVLRNLRQYLIEDDENETAYLQLPQRDSWWYWYGSETEANAYLLKLLARVEPTGRMAPRMVKYLLNNRKHATYWNSTRDTALCVEAFADFLRATGEARPDMVVEVWVDGEQKKAVEITAENLFAFDNALVLEGDQLADGAHEIEIRRRGRGPVYFNALLANFSLEDPITRAGLEIKVDRRYWHLIPADKSVKVAGSRGQALDQKAEKYERQRLENLAQVTSGDLVEVELVIDSKNDYEYLIFEDAKAAGLEPVAVRSGYTRNGIGAYMELRDQRVCFFVRRLPRGRHSVRYRMRAETPGRFSALPSTGQGMYAPELRANSDELKLRITD
jgi:uncharacterized protein YfaS (alpha-2-macroglobulin family)